MRSGSGECLWLVSSEIQLVQEFSSSIAVPKRDVYGAVLVDVRESEDSFSLIDLAWN